MSNDFVYKGRRPRKRYTPPVTPRFLREHGTWPMNGYRYRVYQRRIWRNAPLRHRNSCWSVLDPKRACDCGVRAAQRR